MAIVWLETWRWQLIPIFRKAGRNCRAHQRPMSETSRPLPLSFIYDDLWSLISEDIAA
jgi:hypothetical protein